MRLLKFKHTMGREPILMSVTGKKGVGKSYKTMEYLKQYRDGNPAAGIPGRKILIFDVNNEYADKVKFPFIRALALKDVKLYSARPYAEIRRIAPFYDNGVPMTLNGMAETLEWLVRNFTRGLLLIEDINKYVGDNMPGDLIGAICTNRHSEVDIILHYQSIGRITPKVWQNMNVIRMHKGSDSVLRHRSKFEDKFEYLIIAEKIIHKQFMSGNMRYYLFVDFDNEKIHPFTQQMEGFSITEEDVRFAVGDYVSDYYSQLITPMLNKRGQDGGKLHTEEQAYLAVNNGLLERYFDLSK